MARSPEPGSFAPTAPKEHDEIIRLFAIAARAACAKPERLSEIGARLSELVRGLVRPELLTADECVRLWAVFVRAVERLPRDKWVIAGRALLGDLESLAQKLDLMPLSSWSKLPEGIEDPKARSPVATVVSGEGAAIASVLTRVRDELLRRKAPLAEPAYDLCARLSRSERDALLRELVKLDALSKSEAAMLTRVFAKNVELAEGDEALREVLTRVAERVLAHK